MRNYFRGQYFLLHLDRWVLSRLFRFDKWHVQKIGDRPYVKYIIDRCSSDKDIREKTGLEIGCGLGDILGSIPFKKRIFYDYDGQVLKCARFLSNIKGRRNCEFYRLEFPKEEVSATGDYIFLVNWIHLIEPSILKTNVIKLFNHNLNVNGIIVMDSAQSSYHMHTHNIHDIFQGLNVEIEESGNFEMGRVIYFIRKKV